ncbi:MAG: AarF/ABC1/UbiB kinase family protein [Deltaproteobacteria bacterium]|nr:AarF/ABC1/UbiB kinase family protein [Deltaproteobacteria bacterium]
MRVVETTEAHRSVDGWRTQTAQQPVSPPWRIFKAYLVTLVVLSSYLWLRFQSRYRSPARIAAKLELLHVKNAQRIYRAIVELQGLYIKVGQLISCMSNFLPPAFRQELDTLQDRVPPRSYEAIERRVRDEFDGRGPLDLFESFEEQPIASASIGQVHVAQLPGGHRVAVKVQYPDIERIVRADLRALARIFQLVQRFIPYKGMDSVYSEIRDMILEELDYTAEARNSANVGKNFANDEDVRFPRVVRELTTKRVLTTEFVPGVKVNNMRALAQINVDRGKLARLVIESYCRQIFDHGLYHADPHPGNILVTEGPKIHFIDFGAVAELSDTMRHGLVELLHGALNRDTQRLTAALRDMGFIAHKADPQIYERVIEYFYGRVQAELHLDSFNLKDIKIDPQKGLENLADLRQMDISLAELTTTFHVPKEWIMLERTILMVMGLCTELDPNLNPMDVIRPHIEKFVLGEAGDWSRFMLDTSRDVALSVMALPAELKKFTNRAMQGDLAVRVLGQVDNAAIYVGLGHQLIFTALGITSAVGALHFHEGGWHEAAVGCTVAAGAFGLLLFRSMWSTQRKLRRRPRQR